jgi:hypothetical protein
MAAGWVRVDDELLTDLDARAPAGSLIVVTGPLDAGFGAMRRGCGSYAKRESIAA